MKLYSVPLETYFEGFACMYICVSHAYLVKRASDPMELVLLMVMSHDVDVGTEPWSSARASALNL